MNTNEQKIIPHSPEGRRVLAKMTLRLLEFWSLDQDEQFALLGLSSIEDLRAFQEGVSLTLCPTLSDRAVLLLGIHRSLRALFPENAELCYSWVRFRNRDFDYQTPLQIMLDEGLQGIARASWSLGVHTDPDAINAAIQEANRRYRKALSPAAEE